MNARTKQARTIATFQFVPICFIIGKFYNRRLKKSLKFSPSLADTAGKPKFRLGSASQIETLAIADVASSMWEQASSCLS